jgi:hypothetical protein
MKKAELKQGVAYFVSTRGNYGWSGSTSAYKLHRANISSRYYVIFTGAEPWTGYRSTGQIYMTNCPTYGRDCPTHKTDGERINCYRTDFRLMDIRGEYWELIKQFHKRNIEKAKPKDVRALRLARIAKRNQEKQEEPIKAEFYAVLRQITGSYCSSYDRLGGFTVQEMQTITNAIKAGMPSVQAVAS